MAPKPYIFILMTILSMGIIFQSCASGKTDMKHNSSEYLDSSYDQIENFERYIEDAKAKGVPELAPEQYQKAMDEFKRAKDYARHGDEPKKFRESMHSARVHLDRAVDEAETNREPN